MLLLYAPPPRKFAENNQILAKGLCAVADARLIQLLLGLPSQEIGPRRSIFIYQPGDSLLNALPSKREGIDIELEFGWYSFSANNGLSYFSPHKLLNQVHSGC